MQKKSLQDLLEWSDGTATYERNLLNKVSDYEEVVIFGAGIGGKMTCDLLEKYYYGNKIKAFSDNNPSKIGTIYRDLPVIAPAEIAVNFLTALVLISSTAYNVIKEQLLNMGLKPENIFYFQPAGISLDNNADMLFIKEKMREFERVYAMLADEKSKIIYRCQLNYRITKDINWLEQMRNMIDLECNQYFDTEILQDYSFQTGFVDAGAYTGDTIARFYERYPAWTGKYYCLEAGKDIYVRLCENVRKMEREGIIPLNYAVWDKEGELCFDTTSFGDGGGSHVSEKGAIVKCNSLDCLLDEENIDFIKMDIEGAEKKALEGARQVIQKNRPILAICIYHKPEDFFEIPLLIAEMMPEEYDYYIRQYRYGQSETVLYAMPRVRKK